MNTFCTGENAVTTNNVHIHHQKTNIFMVSKGFCLTVYAHEF